MTTIRGARPADGEAFVRLVAACWAEYPGLAHGLAAETPAIRALADAPPQDGAVWAAESEGSVVGMVAVWPAGVDGAEWELGRMYVEAGQRGRGVAASLLERAEARARERGGHRVSLWSDTRLHRAHAFYEKHSFLRQGALRALDDGSGSIDVGYAKPLSGLRVEVLDMAGADSAVPRLAALLTACVAAGAAVSFLPPLPLPEAVAFWRARAREVALGTRLLLAAWLDGVLVGAVTIDCATPPNQPHRADLQKLLVDPAARRRGVGRALMRAAEAAAVAAGRTLLTLDTRADDAAEPLYRALGWTEAGRIPDYARNPDGSFHDTVIFWKRPSSGNDRGMADGR